MEEKSLKIYKSLFYMNLDSLKNLIQEERDLHLTFPIPKEIAYPEPYVKLTAFDILRMKIDIWARVKNNEDLKILTGFLPDKIFTRALECKEYLDAKFPDFKADFEYEKHRNLMLDFYADKNYIGEDAFNDYINQGFESSDLKLVNAAMARNEALVIDLLKRGADPTVDIFNRDAMIDLVGYLVNKESLCFSDYNFLLMSDFNQYKSNKIIRGLSVLYAAASTAKMLLLIGFYKEGE
ncbi:MAG: hypothetical protein RQ864_08655 [Lutibacter sp.]|nr:hypothetical protein [Lutibacter sp.]MDT8417862.1 hypothetical protein [Lutibacter sp.]